MSKLLFGQRLFGQDQSAKCFLFGASTRNKAKQGSLRVYCKSIAQLEKKNRKYNGKLVKTNKKKYL